jgi:hypothetical protein
MMAQDAFEHWRALVNPAEHDPQGSVGFPLGSTPDESFANMMAYLKVRHTLFAVVFAKQALGIIRPRRTRVLAALRRTARA